LAFRGKVPGVVQVFYVADFALSLAYLLNVGAGRPFGKLTALLDLDGESNLPTWYSSIQLFVVAVLLGFFAYRTFEKSRISSWLLSLLPLVFVVLSIDEVAEIHEWLGKKSDVLLPGGTRGNTPFGETGIWMFLIGIPFLAFMVFLIRSVRVYFRNKPGVLRKFVLGMLIFVGGAAGMDTAANFVVIGSRAHVLEILMEELCEMLGVTTILWATCDLLRGYGFSVHLDAVKNDPPCE
jgi:hypothetical protein